jgi:DNA-binding beta-propeller fold protein YncE
MFVTAFHRSACRRRLWALLCLLALPAGVAHAVDLAAGLTGAIGVAHDNVTNSLYFVDFNAGTLKRIDLTPDCEAGLVACAPPATVTSGLSHPEDVAVNAAAGMGYVTTRDAPGTGALWRVNLSTGIKSVVTFNLGAPHQIVLGSPNSAYLVGFNSGRLYQVNLTTGVRTTLISGLDHPVGLAVKADRTRAFVSEQAAGGGRIREIDLVTRTVVRTVVSGLTSPFYLALRRDDEWGSPREVADTQLPGKSSKLQSCKTVP